jgi:hypothetical protein
MRSIELFAAVLGAVLGWVGIGLLLLGPSAAGATLSIDPGGVGAASTTKLSLLQAGVAPVLAIGLAAAAIACGALVVGAWLHARGDRQARRLVAAAAVVLAAVAVLGGTALPYLLPGAAIAVLAAIVALAPDGRRRVA